MARCAPALAGSRSCSRTAPSRAACSGLVKDNVGYDLAQIMAGQRRHPRRGDKGRAPPRARSPASASRPSSPCAAPSTRRRSRQQCPRRVGGGSRLSQLGCAGAWTGSTPSSSSSRTGWRSSERWRAFPRPPDPGADAWLLVEASGGQDPTGMLAEAIEDAAGVTRGRRRRRRRRAVPACGRTGSATPRRSRRSGVPHKLDVTLPLDGARRVRRCGPRRGLGGARARGRASPGHLVRPRR